MFKVVMSLLYHWDRIVNVWMVQVHLYQVAPNFSYNGVLSYKRLMVTCCRMGSYFYDWIDYNGVAFSIELLEWGRTFSDFWAMKGLHIYG